MEGERELQHFIANYYSSLFTSTGSNNEALLNDVPQRVTPEMNSHLSEAFCVGDIKEALNSMGDLKAPGPDGMPAIFYKRFWGLIGEKVLGVLNGGICPWAGMKLSLS